MGDEDLGEQLLVTQGAFAGRARGPGILGGAGDSEPGALQVGPLVVLTLKKLVIQEEAV